MSQDVILENSPPVESDNGTSEAPVEIDPIEEAATKYTKLLPYVAKLSEAMPSKGGLVRVNVAMAEFPLGGRQPRLHNAAERQLFAVMQELNGYKTTVVQSFVKERLEAEKLKQTATDVAETDMSNGGSENKE